MKILFIGNSHTYMNDMPKLAGEMIENVTGEFCEVFMLGIFGKIAQVAYGGGVLFRALQYPSRRI